MKASQTMVVKTRIMLELQDDMNRCVDADWLDRDREWYRAIWIECAELMDHYGGWKWWKHSTPDYAQALLEIVDIWHFGLSLRIDHSRDYRRIASEIVAEWQAATPSGDFLAEVESLARAALAERRFAVGPVRYLLAGCDGAFDDLYRHYIGKNVLNVFRQDHGYREGTYRKRWQGREDNEVLSDILGELDSDRADFREAVRDALAARYATAVGDADRA